MGRRIAVFCGLLLAAVVIETTLVPVIALRGFQPDLLLLVVLAAAATDGPFTGIRVALAAGLIGDLLTVVSPFGVSVAVYAGCGYLVGVLRPYVYRASVIAAAALGGVFTFVGAVVTGGAQVLLAGVSLPWGFVFEVALIAGTVNALAAPLLFPALPKMLGPVRPGSARDEL